MRILIFNLVVSLLLLTTTVTSQTKQSTAKEELPVNIILMVGDGMGLPQLSTSFFWGEGTPNFQRFIDLGLIITSSSKQKVTDSAAGATAFASGVKTYNGAIGVTDDKNPTETILEIAEKMGLATGLISTSSITHATPASFYAHVDQRSKQEEIAEFLPGSGVDFFAGGGIKWFNKRSDGKDLFTLFKNNQYVMDTTEIRDCHDTGKKYGYLLAENQLPAIHEGRGDFLPNASIAAINHLNTYENGFFLMIEGSQIDWGGHDNNPDYVINEVLDFDKTIGIVLDFAEKNGNTLVIVTADHETGGFTLGGATRTRSDGTTYSDYHEIEGKFSTGGHSATLIPVFAFGPQSESFRGIYENNEIFFKMMNLMAPSLNN